jgi:hypothetical protein
MSLKRSAVEERAAFAIGDAFPIAATFHRSASQGELSQLGALRNRLRKQVDAKPLRFMLPLDVL